VGRAAAEPPEEPKAKTWQPLPVTEEQRRNGITVIPPALRPRVIFRFADSKDLLVSGLLEGGSEIAQHAACQGSDARCKVSWHYIAGKFPLARKRCEKIGKSACLAL